MVKTSYFNDFLYIDMMQSVRKEDHRHDKACVRIELQSKGWNIDPMTEQEFKLIHAHRPKNLTSHMKQVCGNSRGGPNIKVIRQQTMELGGDEVRGEFCDYSVFVETKSKEGGIIEVFRGFNQNLNEAFDNEEDSILFAVRKDIRKCVIEFEHAYTKWKQMRLLARDRVIPFFNNLEKVDQKHLDSYGLKSTNNENISILVEKLNDWLQKENEAYDQDDTFYEEAKEFLRLAAIAAPGMFLQEDVSFIKIGKTLQCALLQAIYDATRMIRTGFIHLHQLSAGISVYAHQMFFLLNEDDYHPIENIPKRITVINPGKYIPFCKTAVLFLQSSY